MIHDLEDLNDASVHAVDGAIGRVCNILFDDRSWTVRYLVVDVRTWMVRHDVVIPVEAIKRLAWDVKSIDVQLTRAELRASPGLDSLRPVSRQQEIAVRKYYGWPKYWREDEFPSPARGKKDFPPGTGDDPHLRSTEDINGYTVWELNEDLGRIESFVMEDSSWHIGYVAVKTGTWLHHRSMLIPTRWVESISWSQSRVWLKAVLGAPTHSVASGF